MFFKINIGNSIPIALTLLCCSIANNAMAIDPNSNLPIQIESDRATLDDKTGISNYAGNVIISQGLSRLEADNISVNALDHKIVSIKATGHPAHFIQQESINSLSTHGYGNTIIYTTENELLKFLGNARLVQKDNSFSGEQIEYDIVRKAIRAKGDESIGSRVKIQYNPSTPPSNTLPTDMSVKQSPPVLPKKNLNINEAATYNENP